MAGAVEAPSLHAPVAASFTVGIFATENPIDPDDIIGGHTDSAGPAINGRIQAAKVRAKGAPRRFLWTPRGAGVELRGA